MFLLETVVGRVVQVVAPTWALTNSLLIGMQRPRVPRCKLRDISKYVERCVPMNRCIEYVR